jgi:hypothetical protein
MVVQGGHQCFGIIEFLARDLLRQFVYDFTGGIDTDIGHQQHGLDFLQQRCINGLAAKYQVGDTPGQALAGAGKTVLEAGKQAGLFRFVFCSRYFVLECLNA